MNLGQARVVIRERAMAELIDLAFRFVLGLERRLYLWLSATCLLPAFLICVAAELYGLSWPLVWCLAVVLRALCDAPFTIAAGRAMFERNLGVRAVLRDSLRIAWRFFWVSVVRVSGMVLAALPLITLPLIMPRLLFLNEIVLLERLRLGEALRRGGRFLGRRRWTGIEAALALLALPITAAVLFEVLGQAIVKDVLEFGEAGASLFDAGGSYFALAGFFAAAPFACALRYLVYIDVRTRREAWDIQVRFQRVSLDLERGLS